MENDIKNKNCILIVDDDFINRELLKNIFSAQYTFEEADNGRAGLEQIQRHLDKLCAIILDVQMPEMTGIELLEIISRQGIPEKVPTFLITAQDDDDLVAAAYHMGVVDVVAKPVIPVVVQKRVKTVIELFSARETLSATVKGQEQQLNESAKAIDELHRGTIEALATAIEFRDIESGQHVSRLYGMTKYILSNTAFGEGLSADTIESIARGAIMHDVGKIAISDVILNKPGRLTAEEFEVMKQHTVKGAELLEQICQTQLHESYRYAADIARHHHERWDGKGYPDGLKGDEISIASQVVSIVDVYDALVSVRVYKKPYSHEEAVEMIRSGQCGCFNPKLLACFLEVESVFCKWYTEEDVAETLESLPRDARQTSAMYNQAARTAAGQAEPNAVLDVLLLTTAVQNAYDLIICANLTQNTYYMIDYDRFGTHCAGNEGVFDDLIDAGASSVPVSHRKEFHDTFCRENLLQAYWAGKKSVQLEHPQYGDDGVLHWVGTSALFMEDGRTGDILQITLSRYLDDEYAQREQTRKILTDALNLAEQANHAKYDFLSKMSHDIRTPLNAIIGMTTIIAAHLDDQQKVRNCLSKIGTSSKYLLGIINDVLDYSKIENGRLVLNPVDFNLRDMITELMGEAAAQSQTKQQTVTVTVDDKVGNSYVGDEYRIRQILMNLMDNASRYTQAGGEFALGVEVSHHANQYDVLHFSVTDNGPGICPEFLQQIFEPFAQEHVGNGETIGLGLAICRNLAHLMNGDIGVTSEAGKGSTFTFELPLERGSLTAYSETIDTDVNVLVVDDDDAVCESTALLLHNMGISATTADSGMEAVRLVTMNLGTEEEFDVAIVDWQMPQMDGVETVRQIRRVVGNNVLVVVMSAFDWSTIEEEARAAGVDLFLAKPISEANLRTAIACSEKIRRDHQDIQFSGEKVLVVEDNVFNAEVAKAILEMKNLQVELAVNGKEAYEMFAASQPGTYCAILMDILMPVMDGHEATRAIRASKHPEAKSIPIYAMTANAFHNDILEAKLAGMDGHISKPVDFEEVARILHTVVKKQQAEAAAIKEKREMETYEILIQAGVDMDGLLKRLMGNAALVRMFIGKFIQDKTFEDLQQAFAQQDMQKAEMASHTLKGMCGNLSLTLLFELFTKQVNLIRSHEYAKAEAMMGTITAAYADAVSHMNRWLQEQ